MRIRHNGILHVWLKALTRNINREHAEELLDCCDQLRDETEYEMAKKIVNLVSEINEEIFEQITAGGERMSDKLRYMLLPELKELEDQLADSRAELADKDAKLADKDAKLADKDAKLADKDAKLADKDAKLADSRAELADKDAEIARLRQELDAIRAANA